jgi:peptidoglycan/LPS O-acetylase OafA/YrhL
MAHECPKPFSLGEVSYIGMHTMGIFLLHKPMLQELFMPLFMRITPGPQLAAAVLASLVTLPASMALCVLVERYIPEMLGQFPNYPSGITAPETKATEATETIATASSQS